MQRKLGAAQAELVPYMKRNVFIVLEFLLTTYSMKLRDSQVEISQTIHCLCDAKFRAWPRVEIH